MSVNLYNNSFINMDDISIACLALNVTFSISKHGFIVKSTKKI